MLPAAHRMRHPRDFTAAVRGGSRAGGRRLVVHQSRADAPEQPSPVGTSPVGPPLVGLVVSRAVGGAVVRNRVARRLRTQLRPHIATLPAGSRTVIRALPAAALAASSDLARDVERQLARLDDRHAGA